MATDMVKVLGCFLWILEKVLLVLRHPVRQSQEVPIHLMANPSLVVKMTVPGVENEFTRLKRNWLLEGYVSTYICIIIMNN
jgi:hypothetical protein